MENPVNEWAPSFLLAQAGTMREICKNRGGTGFTWQLNCRVSGRWMRFGAVFPQSAGRFMWIFHRFVLFAGAAAAVTSAGGHGFDAHLRGPSFVMEPPSRVEFSNSSGAWLDCTATGSPPLNIDWSTADGHPVNDVPGVRRVLRNGTLVLLPFPAAAFRQDVHSAAYRCVASNSVGRVLSRDVQVRAGKKVL